MDPATSMSAEDEEMLALIGDSVAAYLEQNPDAGARPSWLSAVELGWTGLLVPEQDGGAGLDLQAAAVVAGKFGAGARETPLVLHALVPSLLLQQLPRNEHVARLLAGIASGAVPAAAAWMGRAPQIEPEGALCTLEKGRLRGKALLVPMIDMASQVILAASEGCETLLVAIDPAASGVSATPVQLTDGSTSAHLEIDIDAGELVHLGRGVQAEHAMAAAVLGGATLRAWQLSALSQAALHKTRDFLHQRRQFGQALAEMQALQHRMVDLWMECRLAQASCNRAVLELVADSRASAAVIAVSAAKARASATALKVAKSAIQLHGAFGFTEEGGLGKVLGCAQAWAAGFGAASAHKKRLWDMTQGGEA
jgi:alkylation response protein AidB-like acyl-CoA dehydrogenase